jgi:hypothetical protein
LFSFDRKVLFFTVSERCVRPIADQREARSQCSCGACRLKVLEEFAFGALHVQSSFGIGLD